MPQLAPRHFVFLILGFLVVPSVLFAQGRLVGGPCEGCEAVFEWGDRPLTPTDTLPGFAQAQQQLVVRGTIYESDGETPAEGVILYLYHTDEAGEYATRGGESGWARRHGYIRGWIQTDADGRYTFYTRKPGQYGSTPVHIHPTILEPDGRYYYLGAYFFAGDPRLNEHHEETRGGSGVVTLKREGNMLVAERDIVLGLNVPGYE